MRVGQADAQTVQTTGLDHQSYFGQLWHSQLRQRIQQSKRFRAFSQRSQGKLRNNERMDHNFPSGKMFAHLLVIRTKVVDPNRSIGQNQFDLTRRRGMAFNFGIVPPRDANLRALSRSIRALRASRTNAVFSSTPVKSWAMRTRSSSSARVVLIETPRTNYSIK